MPLPKTCLLLCIISYFILSSYSLSFSQTVPLKDGLLKITTSSDSLNKKKPSEKLYLQFDKPYYALGNTIWFKAYLLNDYLTASDKSRIINIDIANDSNKVIKQYRLPVENGITWGNISLNEKDGFTTGTYTIRAYTNWMRNFGKGYFFYKSFYITGGGENGWLVNKQVKETTLNGSNITDVKLQLSNMDKKPFILEPLQLAVMDGNRRLFKQKVQTDLSGLIDVNFTIPQKAGNLTLIAESEKNGKKAVIPIALSRAVNTDVQFLPEGGNLVPGIPVPVGFKAIGEDGKGVQISGIVTDHTRQKVAEFKSLHNGMGSFDLTVKEGETYTAKVTLPGGLIKEYPLPSVKHSGTVLNIKNLMESDYLEVSVFATNDIAKSGNSYFLIGKARGIVCYAAVFDFREGDFMKRKIAKNLFPAGIGHFTVMTAKYQPLNERLVFIDRHDSLNIQFRPDKPRYNARESVALQIKVTDRNGDPVSGNFSFAVTDDAQVKIDSLDSENIITRMLLTSDLKGYVEQPGYYLNSKTSEAWQALDNLLLTQGWVGYDWQQVFNPSAITYQPEKEFMVKGSVFNVFNKPVKGTDVLLFSKKPSILMDTVTDNAGKFVFDHFPRVDTPIFVLRAVNKHGKSFNVGIKTDDIQPPVFTKPFAPTIIPWYVNSDSTLLNYAKSNALIKQQRDFPIGGHILKEVKISAKKIIKDSQNLNGPGEADVILDEKDLEAAGKKTLLQLLQENIKGFREGAFAIGSGLKAIKDGFLSAYVADLSRSLYWYFINGKPVKLIVDGISASKLITSPTSPTAFIDLRDFLVSHSAEDVKGIEIIHTPGYATAYLSRYDPGGLIIGALLNNPSIDISPSDIAFVEITTRGGHGPLIDNTPGMYLYKPLPISWPKQFYKPKYAVKNTAMRLPDLRSTIDWEPNITTGINGEARVWFYTADKSSTYTVIIEGADMNGNLGYKLGKIIAGSK